MDGQRFLQLQSLASGSDSPKTRHSQCGTYAWSAWKSQLWRVFYAVNPTLVRVPPCAYATCAHKHIELAIA
jgi:hypothetical protein